MTKKERNNLTMVLFMQNVAGARNVKPMKGLEALYKDVGLVVLNKKPKYSKELV